MCVGAFVVAYHQVVELVQTRLSRDDWLFQKAGVMQVIRSAVLNESRAGCRRQLLEYSVPSRLFQTFGQPAAMHSAEDLAE